MGRRGRSKLGPGEVTLREAAERSGLAYDTLRTYTKTGSRYAGAFPEPVRRNAAGSGLAWRWSEIETFLNNRPGRGRARDPLRDRRRTARATTRRKAKKVTTEPVKKVPERVCACGCRTVLEPGDRCFGVKNRPGWYILEECGLRMKREAAERSS